MDKRLASLLVPTIVRTRNVLLTEDFMRDCASLPPGKVSEITCGDSKFVVMHLEDFEHILAKAGLGLRSSNGSES
jgi:hypothetical protein